MNLHFYDYKHLLKLKEKYKNGDADLKNAVEDILAKADELIKLGMFTVTSKKNLPPSNDKHDYMTLGVYWWPNPNTKDGLPYIQRDGEVNPESKDDTYDKKTVFNFFQSVNNCSFAYFYTEDLKYGLHAKKLLETWFLNKETKMNPNFNFAQGVPGLAAGRAQGIIEARFLADIYEDILILRNNNILNETDFQSLKKWFKDYYNWLLTDPKAIEERNAPNNHGTWCNAQISYFSIVFDDKKVINQLYPDYLKDGIKRQIRDDGTQPHELARTRPLSYTLFNLTAMFKIIRQGEIIGLNYFGTDTKEGVLFKKALDWVCPYLTGEKKYEKEEQTPLDFNDNYIKLFRLAYKKYKDEKFENIIKLKLGADYKKSIVNLIFSPD